MHAHHTRLAAPVPNRLDFLDMLRGVAALAVFVSHVCVALSLVARSAILTYINIGHIGVIIFFLSSGYIIPRSLTRAGSLRTFWIRRVFRLYPLYWFNIGIVLALAVEPYPIRTLLANVTMLQLLVGAPYLSEVYWTLSIELLFYLAVTLAFRFKVLDRPVHIAIGLALGAIVIESILPVLTGALVISPTISYLAVMWTGTVIAGAVEGTIPWRRALLVALLTLLVSTVPLDPGIWRLLRWEASNVPARVIGFAVFGLALLLRNRPLPRVLCWFGEISYSVYLLHALIITYIAPIGGPVAASLVWFVLTLGVSALTYRWIELPAIALGRRLTTVGVSRDFKQGAYQGSTPTSR